MKIRIDDAARAMKGTLHGSEDTGVTTGASIDSRTTKTGDLFFALPGDYFDGHEFVRDAFTRGAAAAVVTRPVEGVSGSQIVVDDPAQALTQLARWWRDEVDPIVVGITGSTGKTSTKDLLAAVCEAKFSTIASEKNLNNDLGLPLTLLRLRRETEVAVTEMGARGRGQIRSLCETARPSVGVVTNVGVTHFELFGSRQAIAEAKSELITSLPEGGTAVLNADDPEVAAMSRLTDAEVLTYGLGNGPGSRAWLTATGIKSDALGRPSFRMSQGGASAWVELAMSGKHQVSNALAAAAAGMALGISLEECAAALGMAKGSEWRMQVETFGGAVLVNDAYNANPTSMASALSTCAEMVTGGGKLIAVLGHMAELGELAEEEHRRLGALAASLAGALLAVGPQARLVSQGAAAAGMSDVVEIDDASQVSERLVKMIEPGDVVLVKGSRSAGLEGIVDELRTVVGKP